MALLDDDDLASAKSRDGGQERPSKDDPFERFGKAFTVFWNECLSNWSNKLALLNLLVLLVYTVVTLFLWVTAHQTLDQTRSNFAAGERAWLFIDFRIDHEPRGVVDNVVDAQRILYPITNSGRTPALHVRHLTDYRLSDAPMLEPDWVAMAAAATKERTDTVEFYKSINKPFPNDAHGDFTVFPGSAQRFTLPISIAGENLEPYRSHNISLWVWSRVDYCDVFGRPHWTKACTVHGSPDSMNPSTFNYCLGGGIETDDGKEASGYECK